MRHIIIALTILLTLGCSSTDALRVASIGTILVTAKDQVIDATAIVVSEMDSYSEEDQEKLKVSYGNLKALYLTAANFQGNRKLMLSNIVELMPSAKVNAEVLYRVLDGNLTNNTPRGREVLENLLYSMAILNAEYEQVLAIGNAKKIRDASLVYMRAFAPILLKLAENL